MRISLFLLCLYVLICVGYVQAQTSMENATEISSLISPQIVLKDVIDKPADKPAEPPAENVIDEPAKSPVEESTTDPPEESPWKEKDIQLDATDSSVKGRFIYHRKPSVWRFGFEVGGKSANGYTGLLDGSNISSDIRADIFAIRGWIPETSEADTMPFVRGQWLGFRAGYRHGDYKLVSKDIPTPSGFKDQNLRGGSGLVHYSLLIPWKFFAGVSIGCASQNNYSELRQVEVINTETLKSSDNNLQVTERSVRARDGDYEDFWLLSADIDFLWIPNLPEKGSKETPPTKKGLDKTIGLGAFVRFTRRVETTSMSEITWEPGLGFYLFDLPDEEKSAEESFISKMAGGIILRYDTGEKDIKLGLITSYNF